MRDSVRLTVLLAVWVLGYGTVAATRSVGPWGPCGGAYKLGCEQFRVDQCADQAWVRDDASVAACCCSLSTDSAFLLLTLPVKKNESTITVHFVAFRRSQRQRCPMAGPKAMDPQAHEIHSRSCFGSDTCDAKARIKQIDVYTRCRLLVLMVIAVQGRTSITGSADPTDQEHYPDKKQCFSSGNNAEVRLISLSCQQRRPLQYNCTMQWPRVSLRSHASCMQQWAVLVWCNTVLLAMCMSKPIRHLKHDVQQKQPPALLVTHGYCVADP